jgi:hypothetical protein
MLFDQTFLLLHEHAVAQFVWLADYCAEQEVEYRSSLLAAGGTFPCPIQNPEAPNTCTHSPTPPSFPGKYSECALTANGISLHSCPFGTDWNQSGASFAILY